MSVLVVGLSHKSAPIATLERASVGDDSLRKLLADIVRLPDVAETFVISTCNRVEVYADVDRFHGAVAGICELLSRYSGVPSADLTPCLYVHYEDRAVQHLLAVASGLDSMVVGEDQIIGQVRAAIKVAEENQAMSRVLRDLGRVALRVGKRARAETGIDRMGASLVSVGIELALEYLGSGPGTIPSLAAEASPQAAAVAGFPGNADAAGFPGHEDFAGFPGNADAAGFPGHEDFAGFPGNADVAEAFAAAPEGRPGARPLRDVRLLVVGAGTMSGLAVATAARQGAARLVVANRTRERAERLAASGGGVAADLADLASEIAAADLVISCTGAAGLVITEAVAAEALALRARRAEPAEGPLVLLDLAMPRDVDPAVGRLPGVAVIGIDQLSGSGQAAVGASDLAAVKTIVEEELAAHGLAVRAAQVTPTVVALRAKAATVVDAELARLEGRLIDEGLSGHALDEIARTVRRVVDKLLHAPTVRVKELASAPGGEDYAAALRVLFDLDPRAVEAVTRAEADPLNSTDEEGDL
jgi:glutamyl-tRNA reductase